jgi:L-aspartate oxidase
LVLKNPKIKVLENHFLIDLITNKSIKDFHTGPTECFGGYFLNSKSGEVTALNARVTILATGGAGKTYLYTSNWEGATGDGVAAAHRAGARIANMEFTQFHPTCLYHKDERSFLISEALRGEGGVLVNKSGFPFMTKYHELKDLAPRDIVARSIDHELKSSGDECVYLDMKALSPKEIQEKFPAIFQKCLSLGIDISKDKIPVVPAAHYMCGGVLSTVNGETDILRLHAIGEVACNGFHGANRLASNSLLECLASAYNSARAVREKWEGSLSKHKFAPRPWVYTQKSNTDELAVINHIWDEIRRLMWNYVGIVRSNKRLDRAQSRLKNILSEITEYYWDFTLTSDILELRNIATVANLTVECALKRKESRGIHFNLDYPNTLETEALPTILSFKS